LFKGPHKKRKKNRYVRYIKGNPRFTNPLSGTTIKNADLYGQSATDPKYNPS
jgi:hypothetical protein